MDVAPPPVEQMTVTGMAYGSFLARVRAMVVDSIVVLSILLVIVFTASAVEVDIASRLAVLGIAILLFFYDPILVWRFGATLGHRWSNLQVVSERTGGHPGLGAAFARFLVKAVLGLPSFILMALTRRHQALHDRVAGTTVRIRDLSRARDLDVAWERRDVELAPPGLPSGIRRAAITIVYLAASFVGLTVLSLRIVSDDCIMTEACTSGEDLRLNVASIAWLVLVAACIIAGWRGHLWGARRRASVIELTPQDG